VTGIIMRPALGSYSERTRPLTVIMSQIRPNSAPIEFIKVLVSWRIFQSFDSRPEGLLRVAARQDNESPRARRFRTRPKEARTTKPALAWPPFLCTLSPGTRSKQTGIRGLPPGHTHTRWTRPVPGVRQAPPADHLRVQHKRPPKSDPSSGRCHRLASSRNAGRKERGTGSG
jgi:hypothetical protein